MEDTQLRTQSTYSEAPMRRGADWSAIWGGVFVFAAIWGVFETLAFAIFGGPRTLANVQTGMGAGLAGIATQRSGLSARHDDVRSHRR